MDSELVEDGWPVGNAFIPMFYGFLGGEVEYFSEGVITHETAFVLGVFSED